MRLQNNSNVWENRDIKINVLRKYWKNHVINFLNSVIFPMHTRKTVVISNTGVAFKLNNAELYGWFSIATPVCGLNRVRQSTACKRTSKQSSSVSKCLAQRANR
jgi:hypothetical protein